MHTTQRCRLTKIKVQTYNFLGGGSYKHANIKFTTRVEGTTIPHKNKHLKSSMLFYKVSSDTLHRLCQVRILNNKLLSFVAGRKKKQNRHSSSQCLKCKKNAPVSINSVVVSNLTPFLAFLYLKKL